MEMSNTKQCPHCDVQVSVDALFCDTCGRPVVGGGDSGAPAPYLISPARIVFLTILSLGLYTVYWLYKTWQHYRDHTGAGVYPVWHGLTALVPIYGSFRAHAHLRSFGELGSTVGLTLAFSPGLAFGAMLIGWLRLFVAEGSPISLVLLVVSLLAQLWMMLHAQPRINYYWDHAYGPRLRSMSIGKGEIIVIVIGALGWLGTLASIFIDPVAMQNGANGGS